jgi:preprotein translocase SecE subunit
MPEPTKLDPKKAKKAENPRLIAAQERLASLSKGPSGAAKPASPSQFFKETWRELKLTTWPDQATLRKSTYVVLAFIAAAGLFTGALDLLLGQLTKGLTQQ